MPPNAKDADLPSGRWERSPDRPLRYPFKKTARLLKRREFLLLSRSGKKIHGTHFLALFQASKSGGTRLGITVTKKVADAPGRNRIKRLVRESFRHHRPTIRGCWDINIVAKQRANQMTSVEAFGELKSIFEKISRSDDNQADPHCSLAYRH